MAPPAPTEDVNYPGETKERHALEEDVQQGSSALLFFHPFTPLAGVRILHEATEVLLPRGDTVQLHWVVREKRK